MTVLAVRGRRLDGGVRGVVGMGFEGAKRRGGLHFVVASVCENGGFV